MLSKEVLEKPCFYISDYFEKNRNSYYEALDRVRIKQLQLVTGLAQSTVDAVVRKFLEKDILKEITGYGRNRIFMLYRYFNISANID